jgi:hypothetical protein
MRCIHCGNPRVSDAVEDEWGEPVCSECAERLSRVWELEEVINSPATAEWDELP